MKINWKALLVCLAIPLAVGGLSAFLTKDVMTTYQSLNQPPLSPPGWLFPIVWTVLFILMGIASYLVLTSQKPTTEIKSALTYYGVQLAVNFVWPILFFTMGRYLLSFFWLILLWVLILYVLILFCRIRKSAGLLLVPYLLWVTFAGYLNLSVYLLNS